MNPDQMEQRRHFIAGLRAVAEFYEQNPDAYYDGMPITLSMYAWGGAARQTLRRMALAWPHATRSMTTITLLFPGSSVSR